MYIKMQSPPTAPTSTDFTHTIRTKSLPSEITTLAETIGRTRNSDSPSTFLGALLIATASSDDQDASVDNISVRLAIIAHTNPDLFKAIAALFEPESKSFLCRPSCSGFYSFTIAALIFLVMFFEYFFSAQAQIDDRKLAIICSTDSVLLNVALVTYALRHSIDAFVFNLIAFFGQVASALYSCSSKALIAMIDRNLPCAWSATGRKVLYAHRSGLGFAFEMIKPLLSIILQLSGFLASYFLAVILFQNSKNAFDAALDKKAWLNQFFSRDMYYGSDHGPGIFLMLNYAQMITTTFLNALEHSHQIRVVIDTTPRSASMPINPLAFLQQFNIFAPGFETRDPARNLQYIIAHLGARNKDVIKHHITTSLTSRSTFNMTTNTPGESDSEASESFKAHPLDRRATISQSDVNTFEDALNSQCIDILKSTHEHASFRLAFLIFVALSMIATVYYSIGIKPLFIEASHNDELPFHTTDLMRIFKADTDTGALVIAFLAVGIFATSYGTAGLSKPLRDSFIRMYHQNSLLAKLSVLAVIVLTLGLSGFSGATASFESGAGKHDIYAFMGGLKGASVNAVGAYAFALLFVAFIGKVLNTLYEACCCRDDSKKRGTTAFAHAHGAAATATGDEVIITLGDTLATPLLAGTVN